MKDEDLLAIVAAILAAGKDQDPEELFYRAATLINGARRCATYLKETTWLKEEFEALRDY